MKWKLSYTTSLRIHVLKCSDLLKTIAIENMIIFYWIIYSLIYNIFHTFLLYTSNEWLCYWHIFIHHIYSCLTVFWEQKWYDEDSELWACFLTVNDPAVYSFKSNNFSKICFYMSNIPEPSRLSILWPGVYSKPHKFFDTTAYLSSSSSSSSSERSVAPKSEPSVLDIKSIGGMGVLDTLGLLFMCLINCGEILHINNQNNIFLKKQCRSHRGERKFCKTSFRMQNQCIFKKADMECVETINACSDFTDYFLGAGVCCANTMEL